MPKTNIILVIDFSLYKTQLLHNEKIIIINFGNYPATPLHIAFNRRLGVRLRVGLTAQSSFSRRHSLSSSSSHSPPDSNKFINFVFVFFSSLKTYVYFIFDLVSIWSLTNFHRFHSWLAALALVKYIIGKSINDRLSGLARTCIVIKFQPINDNWGINIFFSPIRYQLDEHG